MLAASPIVPASFADELVKMARTRYEKEIRAGNITRADVVPGSPDVGGPHGGLSNHLFGPAARKQTRDRLYTPDPGGSKDLRRAVNAKRYLAHTGPGSQALHGVDADISREWHKDGSPAATVPGGYVGPEGHRQWEKPKIYASPETGQALRAGSIGAEYRLPHEPVDHSLNFMGIQHEVGEAREALQPRAARPFATHLGVEPILRENLALQGDASAQRFTHGMRMQHPEDVTAQKMIRHVGGTPGAPIALDSVRHRALNRRFDTWGVRHLTEDSRAHAMARLYALHKEAPPVDPVAAMKARVAMKAGKAPIAQSGYVPLEAEDALKNVMKTEGRGIKGELKASLRGGTLRSARAGIRNAVAQYKRYGALDSRLTRFVEKGI